MGFPTASFELFQESFDMFIKIDYVTSDGGDIFIKVAELSPDRIRCGVGIKMTFSNDDLQK